MRNDLFLKSDVAAESVRSVTATQHSIDMPESEAASGRNAVILPWLKETPLLSW